MSDCCSTRTGDGDQAKPQRMCPVCGDKGLLVKTNTIRAFLTPDRAHEADGSFHICLNPACTAVYFNSSRFFANAALRTPAGFKDGARPQTVCYCFHHSIESIREEIHSTGTSTAAESIRAEIKAGNCECETKNPKGRCCLGDVNAALKALETQNKQTTNEHK